MRVAMPRRRLAAMDPGIASAANDIDADRTTQTTVPNRVSLRRCAGARSSTTMAALLDQGGGYEIASLDHGRPAEPSFGEPGFTYAYGRLGKISQDQFP
jgi:hypothetical protein